MSEATKALERVVWKVSVSFKLRLSWRGKCFPGVSLEADSSVGLSDAWNKLLLSSDICQTSKEVDRSEKY